MSRSSAGRSSRGIVSPGVFRFFQSLSSGGVASGRTWYGYNALFGENTSYERLDKQLPLSRWLQLLAPSSTVCPMAISLKAYFAQGLLIPQLTSNETNPHRSIIYCSCLLSVCQAAQRRRLFHAGRACRSQPSETKARHEHDLLRLSSRLWPRGAIKILAVTPPNYDYHLSESRLLRNISLDDELVVMGLKKVKLNGIPAVVTTSQRLP